MARIDSGVHRIPVKAIANPTMHADGGFAAAGDRPNPSMDHRETASPPKRS